MTFIDEIVRFLFSTRARIVLIPFVVVLLLFVVLFVFGGGSSAWAPFFYPVF